MIIRKCSISEMEADPNIYLVIAGYAAECAMAGMPPPNPDVEAYKLLEEKGVLTPLGAFLDDGTLVGYLFLLIHPLPHYSARAALVESFYVLSEHRGTGAGTKLMIEAERIAKENGCPGLLMSGPVGGVLAEVLEKTDYKEVSRVFFKRFSVA